MAEAEEKTNTKPVLAAIRAILGVKKLASIADVVKYSGLTYRRVVDILNANAVFLRREEKTGGIFSAHPEAVLRRGLLESDKFYRRDEYGAWSCEGYCLKFNGHDALRSRLETQHVTGGIGDSWTIRVVEDTPSNRAAVEAAGLRLWSESEVDDRLWVEDD